MLTQCRRWKPQSETETFDYLMQDVGLCSPFCAEWRNIMNADASTRGSRVHWALWWKWCGSYVTAFTATTLSGWFWTNVRQPSDFQKNDFLPPGHFQRLGESMTRSTEACCGSILTKTLSALFFLWFVTDVHPHITEVKLGAIICPLCVHKFIFHGIFV